MFKAIRHLIKRFRILKNINAAPAASYFFSEEVDLFLHPTSSIEIKKGSLKIGFDLLSQFPHSARSKSIVALGANAKLIVEDSVVIGPGCSIRAGDGAIVRFKGHNQIDHDLTISCHGEIEIGAHTEASWNLTLMDDDGHDWLTPTGRRKRDARRPLKIGSNVGIFMHTTIINGITIGENSIVGPNVLIRKSVPANCMCFEEPVLKIKEGFRMLPVSGKESDLIL